MDKEIIFPDGTSVPVRLYDADNQYSGYVRPDEMPEEYRIKFFSGIPGACLLLEDGTSGIYEKDVKRFISALERGTWLILKKDNTKE